MNIKSDNGIYLMNQFTALSIMSAAAFVVSFAGTYFLISWLAKRRIIDTPDERTNHKNPTPRGGGVAVVGTILLFLTGASVVHDDLLARIYPVMAAMMILAIVSWIDDRKGLSPIIRLGIQVLLISYISFIHIDDSVFVNNYIPPLLARILLVVIWVWFVNLFNFMDGIDGITGVQTISICIGIFTIALLHDMDKNILFMSDLCAVSMLGFLFWNWHPARIFPGDVGSVPVGFLLGWILLQLVIAGMWAPVIILCLYYIFDSTFTITKRLLQGKKIWHPHSEHFYQQAVRKGKSHSAVVTAIMIANTGFIILAVVTSLDLKYKFEGIFLASVILWGLLMYMKYESE